MVDPDGTLGTIRTELNRLFLEFMNFLLLLSEEVLTALLLIKTPIVFARQAVGAINDPKCDDWEEADIIKRISYKNYLLSVSQPSQSFGV